MKSFAALVSVLFLLLVCLAETPNASALQIDWNGQFWFDFNWINNYNIDRTRPGFDFDTQAINQGGTYVPGSGEKNVTWYSAFLKLKPKITVNDSINIKSEWHVGSPIYGFLGRGYPKSTDESLNFSGAQKSGMDITAQRYWANLITDFGTIELGRAPIHWGLGALWNSGDNLFDRYQNTGDMIRLTSKFGNFWVIPSITKISMGTNLAGAVDAAGNPSAGNDDVTDYDIAAKYDNSEEDFQLGMKWTRRTGNYAQRTILFNAAAPATGSTRLNYSVFDFFFKKKLGHFTLGGEIPYFTGNLGAIDGQNEFTYKALAFVFETGYSSELWDINLKAGHVPGQPTGNVGDSFFRAVYLNKNYNLGLIMFHYNIYGLYNNNPDTVAAGNLNSPYNAPIVNANYVALMPAYKIDKWTLKGGVILGYANETAQSGKQFFNHQTRRFYTANQNQGNFLGKEFDLGLQFQWDENFVLAADLGMWFPGNYYEFTNAPGQRAIDLGMVFASQVRAGISF